MLMPRLSVAFLVGWKVGRGGLRIFVARFQRLLWAVAEINVFNHPFTTNKDWLSQSKL